MLKYDKKLYPMFAKYTQPIVNNTRQIIGRDKEIASIRAALMRPELCNIILLGEAGVGKSALVKGVMAVDTNRNYVEIDLAKMVADSTDVAVILKLLFNEVEMLCNKEHIEIVLFIDEFHQIMQLSSTAVEALKPLLADSGARGVRFICATTYIEFRQYIAPNQPLVERLQRINVSEPDKDMTVRILTSMAEKYNVDNMFLGNQMFELIYEYTNRYIPANAQPRKSLLIFDAMVGWHRATGKTMDAKLLADVIYESEGVNVAFRVDASTIKKRLDDKVFAQDFATSVIEQRLQVCVADLNSKSKPMSSLLFTGATGTGKTEMTRQLANILFGDSTRSLIRMDMTEYANDVSLDRFRNELTSRVWERPYCIILLDEIEKACSSVTKLLLQVLDAGRLIDENNREVSFINAYIVMTTNAGSEIYKNIAQYNASDTGSGEIMKKYNKLIRQSITSTTGGNKFPPELLGRIDTIVPFQPLSENTMKKIVDTKLKELIQEVYKKHNVMLRIRNEVIDYLVYDNLDTDSDSGGARAIMSKLESEVTSKVARFVNNNTNKREAFVVVQGEMAYGNKYQLESEAYIDVIDHKPKIKGRIV